MVPEPTDPFERRLDPRVFFEVSSESLLGEPLLVARLR